MRRVDGGWRRFSLLLHSSGGDIRQTFVRNHGIGFDNFTFERRRVVTLNEIWPILMLAELAKALKTRMSNISE